jgi:hypothetical protein
MKTAISLTIAITASILTSCTSSPTVAALGPGSDTAYLNANRGRADAQISKQQADQYNRQREQVRGEMDLEQQKKANFLDNANGVIGIANGLGGFLR